jgi:hypothetical protein
VITFIYRLLSQRVRTHVQWPRDYRSQAQIDRDYELIFQARVAANVARRQMRIKPDPDFVPEYLREELPSILQPQAA